MSSKKYPYSDDFDDLAGFSLDMSSDLRLRLTNLLMGVQYRFRTPGDDVVKQVHTVTGYGGHRMTVDILRPAHIDAPLPWMYYSHGGGFLMDLLPAHMDICSEYAHRVGCAVVIPHYRVAVNNPFPTSVEDCYAGLEWALENAEELGLDPSRLALAGESAGGALTASLSQMVRDRNLTSPAFQMLVYPVTSHTLSSASMTTMPDAPVWGAANAKLSWSKYLAGHDSPPEYASPLETESFEGLPPAYVEPAEFDVLRDEGIAYARRLLDAGVDTTLNVTPGTIHAFDLNRDSAITQRAMDSRVRALRAALETDSRQLVLTFDVRLEPGARPLLEDYFHRCAERCRSEPKTLSYVWAFDDTGEHAIVIERYADADGFIAHMNATDTSEITQLASIEDVNVCGHLPEPLRVSLAQRFGARFFGPMDGLTG